MKPTITTGIFHRRGTQVQFDPIDRANSLRRYLNFYDPHNHHDVRGFTYTGTENTGHPNYASGDIARFIASGGTDGWKPRFRHILGGKKTGGSSCGSAFQGGTGSATHDEYGCVDGDTHLHERMHNGLGNGTGCGHSHMLRDGKVSKMGDHGGLMGSGPGEVMRVPHLYLLGWTRPEETIVVTESQQVLIAPVEMDGLRTDEYKCVVIRVKGFNDFFLSTHQDWPYNRNDTYDEKLYVHELYPQGYPGVDDPWQGNATLRHEDMMPGEVRLLTSGAIFHYLKWDDGIARVDIAMEGAA